ncbi:MAG TPA: ATP-binding protein [Alphaproteobacteria bacterium]|nr:ATP-binding protein [Alphaproteobacteria bacterium]
MEIKFTIDDVLNKYNEISKLKQPELDRVIYKISHDIKGAYNNVTNLLQVIQDESKNKESNRDIIGEIKEYGKGASNAVKALTEIVNSKEDIYKNPKARDCAETIVQNPKSILRKKPLLMSVINEEHRNTINEYLKSLLETGDKSIDAIINTHNNFFSQDDSLKYSKKTLAGEYMTSESIKAYAQSDEATLTGKIKVDLKSELLSKENIFTDYILPILHNIQNHAWTEKVWDLEGNEYSKNIYGRQNIERECIITDINDPNSRKHYIIIKDNGFGIHHSMQDKIFTKGATGRKEKEEHGRGLNMLYNQIRNIGGNASFVTSEGEGTMFIIELPYSRELEGLNNTYKQ